jgi:hypothetical protein
VLFHSPSGVLFTFPSRYWSTIGRLGSLALEGGPPSFPRGFPCPAVLGSPDHGPRPAFRLRGCYPLWPTVPGRSARQPAAAAGLQPRPSDSRNPGPATLAGLPPARFGLCPVRSPLLRASRLISCPRGTEMFQFPRCAPAPPMDSGEGDGTPSRRVAPFGDPRINACVRLPEAYRSLPRPSSAQGA